MISLLSRGAAVLVLPTAGTVPAEPVNVPEHAPPSRFERLVTQAGSNGLAVTPDGTRVVAATHDQRSVSTYTLDGRTHGVLAADHLGRRFNSPNDVTIAADGTVYFTDPNFQRGNRADQLKGVTGVYRVRGGVVELACGSPPAISVRRTACPTTATSASSRSPSVNEVARQAHRNRQQPHGTLNFIVAAVHGQEFRAVNH
ncbi:SMP-30/gluconolactonase/LRE family protein [Actinoplanes sp. DH11]|uniref:SMP-30/gluconolactonase/LRE family protein n=1 Tax=Actinoplanes sp. DH11 TaxID=2857011 RepID=UPI001E293E24|nr:SMP-30/gluconolactonase/LRE family protein [Actinoplanes sp. DH11]